jgi:hypothetical protein
MSLRKRRKLVAAGFLAATLAIALISGLHHRGEPPGGDAGQGLTLAGHRYTVQGLAFGPDGNTLHSLPGGAGGLGEVPRVLPRRHAPDFRQL